VWPQACRSRRAAQQEVCHDVLPVAITNNEGKDRNLGRRMMELEIASVDPGHVRNIVDLALYPDNAREHVERKMLELPGARGWSRTHKSRKTTSHGMRKSAIVAQCFDFVLTPERIARELTRIT
jgi:hypothetical protein